MDYDRQTLRGLREEYEQCEKRRGSVIITLIIILIFIGAGIFYLRTARPDTFDSIVNVVKSVCVQFKEVLNEPIPENSTGESGEILKDAQSIRFDYVPDSVECTLLSTTSTPLESFTVTSPYGTRTDPVTKEVCATHHGIDLAAPKGSQIRALRSGTVLSAKQDKIYGNCVRIRHTDALETFYAHLSRIDVKEGDSVRAGECIGIIGTTGKSTGIHLHFEVIENGQRIDPSPYLYEKI